MPRAYSHDEEYNKRLDSILEGNKYISEYVEAYKEYEEKYINSISKDMNSLTCRVPQEEYESKAEPEVCAPEPEPMTDDTDIEALVDGIIENDKKAADELIDCISGSGPNSLATIVSDIQKKSEMLAELKQTKDLFDEFYFNARFIEYYLELKNNSSKVKLNLLKIRKPAAISIEISAALLLYSTNAVMLYEPLEKRMVRTTIYMSDYKKLSGYAKIGTKSTKLGIFKNKGNFKLTKSGKLQGKGFLYKRYYDEMSDPVENLFTLSDRGMSKRNNASGDLPVASRNGNGDPVSYIKDIERYKKFYENLDKEISKKAKKCYKETCGTQVSIINELIKELVAAESLSILTKNDKQLIKDFKEFHDEYRKVESEISRLEKELSPESISDMLSRNPCFKPEDSVSAPDSEVDLTGGYSTPFGNDKTLPKFDQACYWAKFCELATTNGLLPFPEVGNTMRYWGVGIQMVMPSGILKIPMPTIWMPIVTSSSKFGVFVVLLGQIGVIPHPFVIWINKNMECRFLITMRGLNLNGDLIGFDRNDIGSLPVKNIYIPRPNLEVFTKMVEGSFNLEKFLNIESSDWDYINEDLIDVKKFDDLSLETTMTDINKLMNAFDEKKNSLKEAIPVSDILLETAEELDKQIDSIKIPELREDRQQKLESFMSKYEVGLEDVREYTEFILDSVELPVISIPEDIDILRYLDLPKPGSRYDSMIKELESIDLPDINLADIKQVKGYITSHIMGVINSGEIQDWIIDNIPEEMDISMEKYFEKIKQFLIKVCNKIIDFINPMIFGLPTFFNDYISELTDFSLSVGFGCGGKEFETKINPIDPDTMAVIEMIKSFIAFSWESLTYDVVKQYITSKILKRSQLVDFAKYMVDVLLPDDALNLADEFCFNPHKILVGVINVMKLIADPKSAVEPFISNIIGDALDFIPKVYIDFNEYKVSIMKFVNKLVELGMIPLAIYSLEDLKSYLHQIVMLAFRQQIPMSIYENIMKTFDTVDDVERYVMKIVKEQLPPIFEVVDIVKSAIQKVNEAAYVVKLIKKANISKNSLDVAFSPKVILDNAANIAKCMAGVSDDCDGIEPMVDIELVSKALELLEDYNFINFIVVASGCWLDRRATETAIRSLHPVSYSDDLPPYERLSLDNSLFCLFLDSFCHMSKTYALFGERYGH